MAPGIDGLPIILPISNNAQILQLSAHASKVPLEERRLSSLYIQASRYAQ